MQSTGGDDVQPRGGIGILLPPGNVPSVLRLPDGTLTGAWQTPDGDFIIFDAGQ